MGVVWTPSTFTHISQENAFGKQVSETAEALNFIFLSSFPTQEAYRRCLLNYQGDGDSARY